MKKKISAEIVADSISEKGHRITTFLLTYPRFIHGEVMTHRLFSRNSASSRAIPFEKMVKMVEEDPFTPVAWQKDHKGMQGKEYELNPDEIQRKIDFWMGARDYAINYASTIYESDTTKQLCNRLLEPFMWHTVLITATEFENFFELRCPKYSIGVDSNIKSKKDAIKLYPNICIGFTYIDWLNINKSQAEIHIQLLAEAMWEAMKRSTPELLLENQWHIPFGDRLEGTMIPYRDNEDNTVHIQYNRSFCGDTQAIKVSVARCARLSYMTFDGEIDYEKDIKLHDQLLESKHMSPFEHIARVPTNEEYFNSVRGTIHTKEVEIDQYDPCGTELEIDIPTHIQGWFDNFHGFQSYRNILEK